jgi:hypothetical protein
MIVLLQKWLSQEAYQFSAVMGHFWLSKNFIGLRDKLENSLEVSGKAGRQALAVFKRFASAVGERLSEIYFRIIGVENKIINSGIP